MLGSPGTQATMLDAPLADWPLPHVDGTQWHCAERSPRTARESSEARTKWQHFSAPSHSRSTQPEAPFATASSFVASPKRPVDGGTDTEWHAVRQRASRASLDPPQTAAVPRPCERLVVENVMRERTRLCLVFVVHRFWAARQMPAAAAIHSGWSRPSLCELSMAPCASGCQASSRTEQWAESRALDRALRRAVRSLRRAPRCAPRSPPRRALELRACGAGSLHRKTEDLTAKERGHSKTKSAESGGRRGRAR
jgi:hypothetical protein